MNKGFLKGLIYYIVGLGLAGLSYSVVGNSYNHGPGLHHIIILLTFIGGFLWLIGAAIQYYAGQRTGNLKGLILTNLLMIFGFILFMVYIIRDATGNREFENNKKQDNNIVSGDTTIMYHHESPAYMKVKDSVLLNFIDSTKFNSDNV